MSRAQTPPELLASLGGFGDLATPAGDKEFAFAEPGKLKRSRPPLS